MSELESLRVRVAVAEKERDRLALAVIRRHHEQMDLRARVAVLEAALQEIESGKGGHSFENTCRVIARAALNGGQE